MKRKTGFTLTEVLLTLAIATIIIIMTFIIYPKVTLNTKVNRELTNIIDVSTNLRSLFAGTSNYNSINGTEATTWAIQANIFPDNMINPSDDTSAYSAFGGKVQLATSAALGSWGRSFKLNYFSLPSEACIKMVAAQFPNLLVIQVQGTSISNNLPGQMQSFDLSYAENLCKTGGDNNTVTFYFY